MTYTAKHFYKALIYKQLKDIDSYCDERPVPLRPMGRSSTMNEAILYDNRGIHFFWRYKTIQNIRRIHAFTLGPVH